jgi:hypothetical protein
MNILGMMGIGKQATEIANGVADVIDRFVETDDEKQAAKILLEKMKQEPDKWQTEINRVSASHKSIFVAGWRPFIGWLCGVSIGCKFIFIPITDVILKSFGIIIIMPNIQTGELFTLLCGMLGMSGLRTFEKSKGLTK